MKIITWNVRGLGEVGKCNKIKNYLADKHVDVLFLQETKIDSPTDWNFKAIGGTFLTGWSVKKADGSKGGMYIGWNEQKWKLLHETVDSFMMHVILENIQTKRIYWFSNVYGPHTTIHRSIMWEECKAVSNNIAGPWLIGGDFNLTRFCGERNREDRNIKDMDAFSDMVRDCGLIDIPLNNRKYTWSNAREDPHLAKLDRFLINSEWEDLHPLTTQAGLASILSDHCPIILDTGIEDKRRIAFRFEKMWVLEEGFDKLMEDKWNSFHIEGDAAKVLMTKLKLLRKFLKNWKKDRWSNMKQRKSDLQEEILNLNILEESRVLSEGEKEFLNNLEKQLYSIMDQEEIAWKQRSRVQWLKEGDHNTAYYHRIANGRRRSNQIHSIKHEGEEVTSQDQLNEIFTGYYKTILDSKADRRCNIRWEELYGNSYNIDGMGEEFSMDEIEAALKDLPSEKAPGPDGFSTFFFKRYWCFLKFDFDKIFQELFAGTLDLGRFNYTNVILIPKKEGAEHVDEFRPISLLNTTFKLITKVLANRLKCNMNQLIDQTQSAFIQKRSLLEGVAALQEIINYNQKTKNKCVLVKLDFTKAFDSINWDFLLETLSKRGFDAKWVGWIKLILTTGKSRIMVNGIGGDLIQSRRGLRQGDPLSPLLFNIAADVFTQMNRMAVRKKFLKSFGGELVEEGVSTLQYADNTILFCSPKVKYLAALKFLLYTYEMVSGLKINFNKSSVIMVGGVDDDAACIIEKILNCKQDKFPFKYLGVTIRPGKLHREDWMPLIDKVDTRLANWKGHSLTRAGRLVLVNSVLSSIPLFWFSYFKAPQWVINKIDQIRRNFFWKGKAVGSSVSCLVSWDSICKSKEQGGLGVVNLTDFNAALLSKWAWNMLTRKEAIWRRWINKANYENNFQLNHLGDKPKNSFSKFWSGVVNRANLFNLGVEKTLGNGRRISFWNDDWCNDITFSKKYPVLYKSVTGHNSTVAEVLKEEGCIIMFTRGLEGRAITQLHLLLADVQEMTCTDEEDRFSWGLTTDGNYTVNSMYKLLNFSGRKFVFAKPLWKCKTPPKFKLHMWTLIMEIHNTIDRLKRKGVEINNLCYMCDEEAETANHLFFQCNIAYKAWVHCAVHLNLGLGTVSDSFFNYWEYDRKKYTKDRTKKWDYLILALGWVIWRERNNRSFRQKSCTLYNICNLILGYYYTWTGEKRTRLQLRIAETTFDEEFIA